MHVLTAFFDIADDGIDLGDIVLMAAFIGGLPTVILLAVLRRERSRTAKIRAAEREAMKKEIGDTVIERTQQIQKNANGGRSLGDLADRVGKVESTITEVRGTVAGVDSRLDVIEGLLRAIVGGHPRTDP